MDLKEHFEKELTPLILDFGIEMQRVMAGMQEKTSTVTFMSLASTKKLLEDQGYPIINDDFESNGYQWDFWYELEISCGKFLIDGCGYHGTLTFRRFVDEVDEVD